MKNYEITHQYNMYKNDSKQYKKLCDLLHVYIYSYPSKISYRYKDFGGDFWFLMQSKIESIIKKFVYRGIPFEAYIATILKYQFITFLQKTINNNKKIHMYDNKKALFAITQEKKYRQQEVRECEDGYITLRAEKPKNFFTISQLIVFLKTCMKSKASEKRIWWFILKYSPVLPKDRVIELSESVGISESYIESIFRSLQDDIAKQEKRREKIVTLCNTYFSMYSYIEKVLGDDTCTHKEVKELNKRRLDLKRKYKKKINTLQFLNFTVSNARISEVLGIPKGTIDSGISLFKKMCIKARETTQFQE